MASVDKRLDDLEDALKIQEGGYKVVYINSPVEPGKRLSDADLAAMDNGLTTLVVVEYVEQPHEH